MIIRHPRAIKYSASQSITLKSNNRLSNKKKIYISLYSEFNLMVKVCSLVTGIYVNVINDRLLWETSRKILCRLQNVYDDFYHLIYRVLLS